MKEIVLHHHLGLGDHFICNGLVHTIAEQLDKINLVCKPHLEKTVKHLYEDYKNIEIFPIVDENIDSLNLAQSLNCKLLMVGFQHTNYNSFEKSFYDQLNIPFNYRYEKFRLPNRLDGSKKLYEKTNLHDYVFVHKVSSVGDFDLNIETNLPIFNATKDDTDDVLDYVDLICNAKEIHFINSGIYPLITQLFKLGKTKAEKICYHNIRPVSMGGIPIDVPNEITEILYL